MDEKLLEKASIIVYLLVTRTRGLGREYTVEEIYKDIDATYSISLDDVKLVVRNLNTKLFSSRPIDAVTYKANLL